MSAPSSPSPGGVLSDAPATSEDHHENLRIVRETFDRWSSGKASLYDLMTEDAEIVIPGVAPHCGTFSKSAFIQEVATPFMARFSEPPAPHLVKIWCDVNDVAVLARAAGTTHDGEPYANDYVFVVEMRDGRVTRATEFLDMVAFNDVWDRVEPATVETAEPS